MIKEAAIAAGLTGLMILLFLGSWRSTLIVVISIPLSILVSIIVLRLLGNTLNVMTLGGMALAVGILVDDATVEIENIHRNMHQGKHLVEAILDGAAQIAVPAFVSTLVHLHRVRAGRVHHRGGEIAIHAAGDGRGVRHAHQLPAQPHAGADDGALLAGARSGAVWRRARGRRRTRAGEEKLASGDFTKAFDRQFEKLRDFYGNCLAWSLANRAAVLVTFGIFIAASASLLPLIGRDFFPAVDSGQIRMHVRAPAGTRIEETERYFAKVEDAIRKLIPADEIKTLIDNIGIPNSGINLSLSDGSMMSPADGEILVTLNDRPSAHGTAHRLRYGGNWATISRSYVLLSAARHRDAGVEFRLVRGDRRANCRPATEPRRELQDCRANPASGLRRFPARSTRICSRFRYTPELQITTDRTLLSQLGLSQSTVANDVLISLSSSGQTAPNFWLDPKTGVQYPLAVQTPQLKIDSVDALDSTPVASPGGKNPQLLANVATRPPPAGADQCDPLQHRAELRRAGQRARHRLGPGVERGEQSAR